MKRYIDADALLKEDFTDSWVDIADQTVFDKIISLVPTADVVEVKHGEWIDRDEKTWCSLCGKSNKQYKPPYCPHCGAKMDGEKVTE